jgi:hypothetical protein
MKRKLALRSLAIVAGVTFTLGISPPTTLAQGTAFTYQGRLNDGAGVANGAYDLRFAIYDALTLGTQQGPALTNSATTVSNGLFTVTLDFGNQFPGANRWLEIAVRTNGGGTFAALNPRQQITPTPYAVHAREAAAANSVAGENITGTIPLTRFPPSVLTNGASGVNLSGSFSGSGAGLDGVRFSRLDGEGQVKIESGSFAPAISNNVPSGLNFVTAADVNGDGRPDLISSHSVGNLLTVLTNDGSGGFVLVTSVFVDANPRCVIAADVNGDHHPDLISANTSGDSLSVLTNDGSGGFQSFGLRLGVGSFPFSVTAADVNGDGLLDLISANSLGNTLSVLTNDASGGFALASTPAVGTNPRCVTAADANGDGRPDLVSANGSANTLTVLTNDGSGGFVLATSPAVGLSPQSVTAADVNGDGRLDLISADSVAHTLTVLTNDGSGGFVLASSPFSISPVSVTVADVNGDGRPDLISANSSVNTLTVLTNAGNGSFAWMSAPDVGSNPRCVTTADVNGDGLPDLISADAGAHSLSVLLNRRFVTFTGPVFALVFNTTSDRNSKEDFQPVVPGDVLEKVLALPLSSWHYKLDGATRHIGPMAQDFYQAFAVGMDDKHIATVDADGVALAAIQGLNQKLEEMRAVNAELKQQVAELKQLVEALAAKN